MRIPKWAGAISVPLALLAIGIASYKHFTNHLNPAPPLSKMAKAQAQAYWTCPMHPEIHSENPGECPICHMRLMQARADTSHTGSIKEVDSRADVSVSSYQIKVLGMQKVPVEKMDLNVHIPISGRLISPARIAFQVYESDLPYIKPGLKFIATSSSFPDPQIKGVISSVDSIADSTSRTIRVLGTIQTGPSGLIAETTFSGDVEVPLKRVIAVPQSSILHGGNSDLVYLVRKDDTLKATAVRLGQKTEGYYEVRDGLQAGDYISSGPNFLIDSEARISAVSMPEGKNGTSGLPSCPPGEHWDLSMTMCMPGKE